MPSLWSSALLLFQSAYSLPINAKWRNKNIAERCSEARSNRQHPRAESWINRERIANFLLAISSIGYDSRYDLQRSIRPSIPPSRSVLIDRENEAEDPARRLAGTAGRESAKQKIRKSTGARVGA